MALSAETTHVYCVGLGETHSNINTPNKTKNIHTNDLFNVKFVEVISSPRKDVIKRVFHAITW